MTQHQIQLAEMPVPAFPPLISELELADLLGTTSAWVRSHSRPARPSRTISTKGIAVNGQIGKSMARRRYEQGQLSAVKGSWIARWREDIITSNGEVRRVRRGTIGNLKQYPTKRLAQRELDRRLKEVNARVQAKAASDLCRVRRAMEDVMKQHKPSSQSS